MKKRLSILTLILICILILIVGCTTKKGNDNLPPLEDYKVASEEYTFGLSNDFKKIFKDGYEFPKNLKEVPKFNFLKGKWINITDNVTVEISKAKDKYIDINYSFLYNNNIYKERARLTFSTLNLTDRETDEIYNRVGYGTYIYGSKDIGDIFCNNINSISGELDGFDKDKLNIPNWENDYPIIKFVMADYEKNIMFNIIKKLSLDQFNIILDNLVFTSRFYDSGWTDATIKRAVNYQGNSINYNYFMKKKQELSNEKNKTQ